MTEKERHELIGKAIAFTDPKTMETINQFTQWLVEFGTEVRKMGPSVDRFARILEIIGTDVALQDKSTKDVLSDQELLSGCIRRALEQIAVEIDSTPQSTLPNVNGRRAKTIPFPVDKMNSTVWDILRTKEIDGQIQLTLAAESAKDKGKQQLNTYVSIDFSGLDKDVKLTRKLEPYDKRVYVAIGALWAAGNQVITIGQIYYAMGGRGNPSDDQRAKIEAAITKMAAAHIYISNEEESEKYNYPKFTYDASLLPMERISATVNGATVESAIHLFREPPLIDYARGRNQITTISRKLLETPLNWTSLNLTIEDYLLESIAHIKKKRRNKRMLYNTIYEKAHVTDKKQRQRTRERTHTILDHYKSCGAIKGYSVDGEGITIDV